MIARHVGLGALLLAVAATPATAQSWRTLTAQRAVGREDSLHVVVRYGLGKLTVRAAEPAVLYDLDMKYDADVFRAEKRYDAATRTLYVGADSATADRLTLRPHNIHGSGEKGRKGGEMTLALARGIPLDLTVELGIGYASIDLGDLWLDRARFESAMGGAEIDFATANIHPMRELDIDAALSGVTVGHLGNARAQRVKVTAALAGGELDLRGAWTGEMTLDLTATLGGFELKVPSDAGVRITASSKLGGIDAKGYTLRDGTYYSANYATAKRKLTITGSATLGGLEVNWVEP